jgi:hypothetical protein
MTFTKESAVNRAKSDLAQRVGVPPAEIAIISVTDKDFPNASLGAPTDGEMSAEMISSGWQISLGTDSDKFEYRADKYQVRLYRYKGKNYIIES